MDGTVYEAPRCAACGDCTDMLYLWDGKRVCRACLKRSMGIAYCPEVCERAEWHADTMFPNLGRGGQYNCPHHFGVDYNVAVMGNEPRCKYLKPKAVTP